MRPPPKVTYNRHILGMSPQKWFPSPKTVPFELQGTQKQPTLQYHIFSCFGTWKIPHAEIRKFFTGVRMQTLIHVFYFKNGRDRCWISGQKAVLHWWQKKKRFGTLRWNPEGDIPHFLLWVHTIAHHLYSRFYPDKFRIGEVVTVKPLHDAPK